MMWINVVSFTVTPISKYKISDDPIPINDSFLNEQLAAVKVTSRDCPWYADYANFVISKYLPPTDRKSVV